MMKYNSFLKNEKKVMTFYKLFFIIIFLFLEGCGGCETAEELGTEEKKIEIKSSYRENSADKTTLWKSSEIFVNAGGINGNNDVNFTIINNNVNLCSESKDIKIESSDLARYIDIGLNVRSGEFVRFSPIKKDIVIDCEASAPGIFITDKDKCLNGYYKQDGSNAFVPPAHKQTISLESYVAIPSDRDKISAQSSGYVNYFHNAFIPKSMIDTSENARLLSKVLLVPSEYESIYKGIYSYSEFPDIEGDANNPTTDLGFIKSKIGNSTDSNVIMEINKKYWCREYSSENLNLRPSQNIDGIALGNLCDQFYYLDKDKADSSQSDRETLMDYETWESTPLNQKNMGNIAQQKKIISILENKSYKELQTPSVDFSEANLPNSMSQSGLQNAIGDKQYLTYIHSKMFVALDGAISNDEPTSTMNMGNLNTDFIDCSKTSYTARCYQYGPMIPFDQNIEVKRDGKLFIRIGTSNLLSANNEYIGNANIKVEKFCPLKNIVAYVLPMDNSKTLDVLPTENDPNFIKIPIRESDGSQVESFTIKGSDIKNNGFIYFAVEDNGDGYENNIGSIKIKTRVPKNFADKSFKFFSRLSDKVMNIIFGRIDPSTNLRRGGVTGALYQNMISSARFQSIIRLMSVLSIVIYGICIVLGVVQVTANELVKKAFKLGVVFALLQPLSWDFFNRFLFSAFIDGARDLAAFTTVPSSVDFANATDDIREQYIFGPLAQIVERFLDFSIWKQILALIFAGPLGYIFFVFLKMTIFSLLEGAFMVFITYTSSMFIIGILVSIAPLFIITLLFQATSHIFKEWIKILISNVVTIVLVFTGINMISSIIGMLINQVFGFGVCTSCVVVYNITDNFPICLFHGALPDGYNATSTIEELDGQRFLEKASDSGRFFGLPIPFGGFIALCIMCPLVKTFHEFCTNMSSELTGVDFGSPTGRQNVASAIGDTMKWWGNKDSEAGQRKAQQAKQDRSRLKNLKTTDD